MLERTVVYVDTSYLLASFYNSWEIGARAQLEIDLPEVVAILDGMISNQLGQRVHRQNWYDGIPDTGPHRYQRALRTCEGVQLRTGQLIEWGERRTQKAVDTRLVADMVTTACKQQFTDMVLVSGDADMIPGVQEATNAGIRVHLYGFGWDSMSAALRHACDTTTILDPREDFTGAMELQVLEGPLPPTVRDHHSEESPVCDAAGEQSVAPSVGDGCAKSPAVHSQEASSPDAPSTSAQLHGTVTSEGDYETTKPDSSQPAAETHGLEKSRIPKPGESPRKPDSDEFAEKLNPTPKPGPLTQSSEVKDAPLAPEDVASTPPATPGDNQSAPNISPAAPTTQSETPPGEALDDDKDPSEVEAELRAYSRATSDSHRDNASDNNEDNAPGSSPASPKPSAPRPSPSMMAPRRKLRSRYVPLPEEVWTSAGFQTPFDVGQQYARWWYDNAASPEQRDQAHLLSGGGLPPEVDRPLLQFACETLHEYTLSETQRVKLRDGFHSGIRGILLNASRDS